MVTSIAYRTATRVLRATGALRLVDTEALPSLRVRRRWKSSIARVVFPTRCSVSETGLAVRVQPPATHLERASRSLFLVHGGGFVAGSPHTYEGFACRVARATGTAVLVVAYRLAPEYPFPAALTDVTGAWRRWLEGGGDHHRSVWVGDSAGAGLALAALTNLRDEGRPLPTGLACFSPWVDLGLSSTSVSRNASTDRGLDPHSLRVCASAYLAGSDARAPAVSPIFADMSGLPPLLVQVGSHEILLDDSLRLVERAKADGVAVQLEVWDGLSHGFQGLPPIVPESRRALRVLAGFVARRLELSRP